MKREKFLQDVKNAPSRFYRNPIDVIRDRRLTKESRLEILVAWENETRALLEKAGSASSEDVTGEKERLEELQRVRDRLKGAA